MGNIDLMLLLDTNIFVWWTDSTADLSSKYRDLIDESEPDGIAVSAISVWEVAMLVKKQRLQLRDSLVVWFQNVMRVPTLHLLPASPQILIDSTQLPGDFHNDPADRIIVATARAMQTPLLTTDAKILNYEHVRSVGPR